MKDVEVHIGKLADKLRPKFDAVLAELDSKLEGLGIAKWRKPNGGYFISLYVLEGCAKRVVELCANAGMTLTPAGATYPYGIDPDDSNIRIAPSFPSVEEISVAAKVLCVAVKYAALEKLLNA
jgi:DNA-binding transcriptional MocR family regulator